MQGLVLTHGDLGRQLVQTARAVVGETGVELEAASNEGLSVQGMVEELRGWLERRSGPVVLMVDAAGGSCATAAQLARIGRDGVWLVAGVNLPMVVAFLSSAALLGAEELVAKLLDRARSGIRLLEEPQ